MGGGPLGYPFGGADGLALDPTYAQLRSCPGLVRVQPPYGGPAWLAARHEDVTAVLESRSFSRVHPSAADEPRVTAAPIVPGSLLSLDPPEHTRLRRAMAGWFHRRRVEAMRPRIGEIAGTLLDGVDSHGSPADLMALFARPFSAVVISEVLGLPESARTRFDAWGGTRRSAMWSLSPAGIAEAGAELRTYLTELVTLRAGDPGDDLISALLYPPDPRDVLTEREVATLAGVLVAGGLEITANRIGSFVYSLVTEPALYRRLREEPEIIALAVEELLRFTTLGARVRAEVATVDTRVGPTLVRAGEAVLPSRCSANRDPSVFDQPDVIDLTRSPNDHLAFGRGVHYCTGAALARVELQEAIAALVRRFPALRLGVPEDRIRWGSVALWAPEELPVTW